MNTRHRIIRGALVLPLALGVAGVMADSAAACDTTTGSAPVAAVSRKDVPITGDGKITLKVTAPAKLGRDGRYHDVTMELINPSPVDYRSATAELGFTGLDDAQTGVLLAARHLRITTETAAGTAPVPLASGCDAWITGTVVDGIALPAGTAQTLHLRLAAAKSTPGELSAITMIGSLRISDESFKWDQVPGATFELGIVDSAPASADRPVTQTSVAESLNGGNDAPDDPAPATTAPAPTTPAASLSPPLTAGPAPDAGDPATQTGLIAIVATILLVSSLGAAALLRRAA